MIAYTGIETISNLSEETRDPPERRPAVDPAGRDRRVRHLLHAARDRALGAAGVARARRLHHRPRPAARGGRVRQRPGARDRRQPRPRGPHARRPRDLRRGARGDDPLHRRQRRRDRRVAHHLLDGELPAAARAVPAAAPALQDAVARAGAVRGRRVDHRDPARADRLPRHDVLVRRDALVHHRPRVARGAARAPARRGARLPGPPQPALPGHRLAAVRDRRRPRDRRRLAGGGGPGARSPAGRASGWLALGFAVYIGLPHAGDPGPASRDGARARPSSSDRRCRSSTARSWCR